MPIRFVACTYNLWAEARIHERKAPLTRFLELHAPDILCVQELRPVTRDLIDATLSGHARVDDPFEGWLRESAIFWNRELFALVEFGTEDVGMLEPLRRLFWARLRLEDGGTLFVATAHYTWIGNATEQAGGPSPRYAQAQRTVKALNRLVPPSEPLLFMGDLNDFAHPIRLLREGGLMDSFGALNRYPRPTHPALPTAHGVPQTIDWMFHRGPIRPMTSEVVDFFADDFAPSDHKPILTTYRIG
jgi:endonuclease/exonuclease/phosphatase (EEP) superfamily protein YafD